MKNRTLIIFVIGMTLLTACAQGTSGSYPPPVIIPSTPTTSVGYPAPTGVPTEPVSTPTHIPVDLTPAQMAAVQLVSTKYNIPVEQIKIVSTEAKSWPNGCLGVVIPGYMCTDIIVDGFRVILEANGQQFEIRTNQDGTNVVDAAQQLGTLGFVVSTADRAIQIVQPNIPLRPTYNPAFNGFLPTGGSIAGTAYVLDFTGQAKAIAIDGSGSHDLTFIQTPTNGLAIWRGGEGSSPMLAWGTQPVQSPFSTSLMISEPDGSNLQTLLTIDLSSDMPTYALAAEFWSMDGQSLYFSKEPIGIGGYILFGGGSNLFKIDVVTKEVTEIIPQSSDTGPMVCLDSISGDFRFVADHCTQKEITIRDLQNGGSTTIQAPADVTGYGSVGSARFSPDGSQVAFALAKGNPDNEQGWVAVGDRSGGASKLILTGEPGSYYTVIGWLDDQTLLVQSTTLSCASGNCPTQLFTVGADGSNQTKVADGSLLTVIDNR